MTRNGHHPCPPQKKPPVNRRRCYSQLKVRIWILLSCQIICYGRERGVQLSAQSVDRSNDCNRNAGGNQPVFSLKKRRTSFFMGGLLASPTSNLRMPLMSRRYFRKLHRLDQFLNTGHVDCRLFSRTKRPPTVPVAKLIRLDRELLVRIDIRADNVLSLS